MDTTLSATKRPDLTGKGAARKLRRTGRIPAVVYGPDHDEALAVHVDPDALQAMFRHTGNRNTVVQLDMDGETIPVLVRAAQRHPVSRDILHVDFYRVSAERPVEVMVPVRGVGRAAGMALGGRLQLIRREVKVRCAYDRIPATLDVDITPMNIEDVVKASELNVPEGVEVVYERDFNVLTILGKRVELMADEEEDEEVEGEETEGEESESESEA